MSQPNESQYPKTLPPQHQSQMPGIESKMNPIPMSDNPNYKASGKLTNKVAIITGGDSGIGKAVAIAYAKEGAKIVISYLNEHDDAEDTKQKVEGYGTQCLIIPGDIGEESICQQIITQTVNTYGQLDILVNNAAEQHPQDSIEKITQQQLERTFKTNIFSFFYMTKAAIPHMHSGGTIINTASITAYKGSANLLDYASTKGAIVSFTRSLSQSVIKQGIRVNGVAPGPIWTPLIPSTFDATQVTSFGSNTPIGRVGQPQELAPSYVFLASEDSSYINGQILHVNGGEVVNG